MDILNEIVFGPVTHFVLLVWICIGSERKSRQIKRLTAELEARGGAINVLADANLSLLRILGPRRWIKRVKRG